MRVALLSNFWYRRGGLERVMMGDAVGLASRGHVVLPFVSAHPLNEATPYADYFPPSLDHSAVGVGLGLRERAFAAVRLVHNRTAVASFRRFVADTRPDIVHLHGTSRQLSPSVLAVARANHVPVVMKVADHIMRCPKAVLSRPGASVCLEESCSGHRYDRAIRFKCIHDSRSASCVAAIELWVNRGLRRYERNVDLFLTPSQYLKDRLIEDGFSPDRVRVEPNPVEPPDDPIRPLGTEFVAYGRLVDYKGFDAVVDVARRMPDVQFVIGGDGPYRAALEHRARDLANIRFAGPLAGTALDDLLSGARAVIFPSLAPEGFGMVTLEAWRAGRPVIAANRGALTEVVTDGVNGFVVDPEHLHEFEHAIRRLDADLEGAVQMGLAGAYEASTKYSMSAHLDRLESIYEGLIR